MTPDNLFSSVPDLGKVLQDSSSMRRVRHTRCTQLLLCNTTAWEEYTHWRIYVHEATLLLRIIRNITEPNGSENRSKWRSLSDLWLHHINLTWSNQDHPSHYGRGPACSTANPECWAAPALFLELHARLTPLRHTLLLFSTKLNPKANPKIHIYTVH